MNIFIIPSWYPSPQHPYTGIFFKEQAIVYSIHNPDDSLAISLWGQNDERLLLWSRDHFKNLVKIWHKQNISKSTIVLSDNCREYFNPCFTWSLKLLGGNIKNIIKKNCENLSRFEETHTKADVILAHVGYPAGYIAHEISKKMSIPYVIMENMSPFPFKYYLRKGGNWMSELESAYRDASKIIAVSKALKNKMENSGHYHVEVIGNFIDDVDFQPKKSIVKNESIRIVVVARLVKQKGLDILIKAADVIRNIDLTIEIIGDGEEESYLKNLVEKYDLEHKFIWQGYKPKEEIIISLQKADLFVLPSRHENLPLAFLEALACGKPCIGTYCGGPEEIISEEVGLIVEKENPAALAEAIEYMIDNLDKYPSSKIRKYYDENFSAKKTVGKLRGLFEKVIQDKKITFPSSSAK